MRCHEQFENTSRVVSCLPTLKCFCILYVLAGEPSAAVRPKYGSGCTSARVGREDKHADTVQGGAALVTFRASDYQLQQGRENGRQGCETCESRLQICQRQRLHAVQLLNPTSLFNYHTLFDVRFKRLRANSGPASSSWQFLLKIPTSLHPKARTTSPRPRTY